MKVKALKGELNRQYTLVLPVDTDVSNLSPSIQEAIKKFGKLTEIERFDLEPSNKLHQEAAERIKTQGADLWKMTVEFTEVG